MSEASSSTVKIAKQYDEFAPRYDSGMRLFERVFVGDGRRWIASTARGDVLEIAIGTGRNLPYYDRSVRVTGIDISPAMLEIARERACELGTEADLRVGDAQQLSFPDGSFDSVVSTASMCTIPDYRAAILEAWRLLRPGGQFLLLEHVRSPNRAVRAIQRLLDPCPRASCATICCVSRPTFCATPVSGSSDSSAPNWASSSACKRGSRHRSVP